MIISLEIERRVRSARLSIFERISLIHEWRNGLNYRCTFPKYPITAQSTCDKRIEIPLNTLVQPALEEEKDFVDGYEFGEVESVGSGREEYLAESVWPAEEYGD
jgi:hypothetical protein